ncbi:MAG: TPM domain-containing protein [Verrucomicrobiota bacterium JB025]|nr:TPM domain-containing protein [Verrucomicrobiota bacterium JB025]
MRCPYCNSALHDSAYECPNCQLSFARAKKILGALPRMDPTVADTTRRLSSADQTKLRRRINELRQQFPELVLQIVIHEFPDGLPLSLHVFWMFNAASFAGDSKRGKNNHSILIALDPRREESAVIPGYGLEPFFTDEALGHLLELAGPAWETGRWTDGFMRVLDGLEPWLESVAIPEDASQSSGSEF